MFLQVLNGFGVAFCGVRLGLGLVLAIDADDEAFLSDIYAAVVWWRPKKYAASNKSVVDIEKSDGKCLNVIEHLLGKTAGFTHCAAYPLA